MPRFIRQIEKILAAKIEFDLSDISHYASQNFFFLFFLFVLFL